MARCTGVSRGWAARSMRWAALRSVATSGSRLPVSCDCCCAMRIAVSMSTISVSSRVRDRLCTSSSSWLRCSVTSPTRASMTEMRAALSRATSCASRAMVRASIACVPESALWRASCSWMLLMRCHSMPLPTSATTATVPTRYRARGEAGRVVAGAARPWAACGKGADWSWTASVLMC
ncbi:hypothetical protein D3C86_1576710 [compost metagenome]